MPPHDDAGPHKMRGMQRQARAARLKLLPLGHFYDGNVCRYAYTMQCGHDDAYSDIELDRLAHKFDANGEAVTCRACRGLVNVLKHDTVLRPNKYTLGPSHLLPTDAPPAPAQPTTPAPLVAQLAEHTKRLDEGDAAFAQLAEIVAAQLADLRSELATIRAHVGMPSSSSTN